eukprot:GGOE01055052.1.p1 GENE.GGOE01055052.1~~GGOE01055052.1.p1  ORF type:complete len:350 (-),score=66.20 GGOE01055052.1:183-1232(-)
MQEFLSYGDSYTATRLAAEPSTGRHLRYVTVMDPGYNEGGVPLMRRFDLGSRYETVNAQEPPTHLYAEQTTYPSYRTVVRASADSVEGELRSELSILRHQIYELRRRSVIPVEEDRFQPSPCSDPSPSLEFLRKEFNSLHQENRQLKEHLDQLRDQMVLLSTRSHPEERRPDNKFPAPAPPHVPVVPVMVEAERPHIREDSRPVLGVELKQRGELLVVHRVVPRGPCDFAGVRTGDILRRWDNYSLNSKEQLDQLLDQTPPGTVVPLTVQRYGRAWPLTLVIGGRKSPQRGRPGANPLPWQEMPKRRFSLTSSATGTSRSTSARGTSSSPTRRRRYYSNPATEDDRCQF